MSDFLNLCRKAWLYRNDDEVAQGNLIFAAGRADAEENLVDLAECHTLAPAHRAVLRTHRITQVRAAAWKIGHASAADFASAAAERDRVVVEALLSRDDVPEDVVRQLTGKVSIPIARTLVRHPVGVPADLVRVALVKLAAVTSLPQVGLTDCLEVVARAEHRDWAMRCVDLPVAWRLHVLAETARLGALSDHEDTVVAMLDDLAAAGLSDPVFDREFQSGLWASRPTDRVVEALYRTSVAFAAVGPEVDSVVAYWGWVRAKLSLDPVALFQEIAAAGPLAVPVLNLAEAWDRVPVERRTLTMAAELLTLLDLNGGAAVRERAEALIAETEHFHVAAAPLVLEMRSRAAPRRGDVPAWMIANPEVFLRAVRQGEHNFLARTLRTLTAEQRTAVFDDYRRNAQAWADSSRAVLASAMPGESGYDVTDIPYRDLLRLADANQSVAGAATATVAAAFAEVVDPVVFLTAMDTMSESFESFGHVLDVATSLSN